MLAYTDQVPQSNTHIYIHLYHMYNTNAYIRFQISLHPTQKRLLNSKPSGHMHLEQRRSITWIWLFANVRLSRNHIQQTNKLMRWMELDKNREKIIWIRKRQLCCFSLLWLYFSKFEPGLLYYYYYFSKFYRSTSVAESWIYRGIFVIICIRALIERKIINFGYWPICTFQLYVFLSNHVIINWKEYIHFVIKVFCF